MNKVNLVLSCAIALCLMGCGSPATNNAPANTANRTNATNAANTNTTTTNTTATKDTKSDAGDKIGVAECDDYIAKWEACVLNNPKFPEAAKAAAKSSFDTMRKTWKESASNPATKAALATGCKTAADTAKTSFAAYSCNW